MILAIAAAGLRAAEPEPDVNSLVTGYSTQRIVELNVGETFTFRLKNGAEGGLRRLELAGVRGQADRAEAEGRGGEDGTGRT
jgi:hypothetical protein